MSFTCSFIHIIFIHISVTVLHLFKVVRDYRRQSLNFVVDKYNFKNLSIEKCI